MFTLGLLIVAAISLALAVYAGIRRAAARACIGGAPSKHKFSPKAVASVFVCAYCPGTLRNHAGWCSGGVADPPPGVKDERRVP